MIRLTDGKKTVEITMGIFDGTNLSPDFSADFFEAGGLPYDNDREAYVVPDVDYCADYANDWKSGTGDFWDSKPDADKDGGERVVYCVYD